MTLSQEERCKGCGLMVQAGYARCPRCTMPQQSAKRRLVAQGGTAVEAPNRTTLVALGAMLVVVGLGLVLARSDDKAEAPAPPEDVEETTSAAPVANQPRPVEGGSVGFTVEPTVDDPREDRRSALDELTERLRSERMWATVSGDGSSDSLVIVVSASCQESGMKPAVAQSAARLRQVGFETLHCVEKHGALVFEQGL